MSDSTGLNFAGLKEASKRMLGAALDRVMAGGSRAKALFIDPSLVCGLGLLDPKKEVLCKERGVESLEVLDDSSNVSDPCPRCVVFLVRPTLDMAHLVARAVVRMHDSRGDGIKYFIFFVPKKAFVVDIYLTQEHNLEKIVGSTNLEIEEIELSLFPIEDDVLSLEMPSAFRDLFMDGDTTILSLVARAITTLQATLIGRIPTVRAKGIFASKIVALLQRQGQEIGEEVLAEKPSQVEALYILDRGLDLLTPMMTQLTYEGLIEELYGINGVDFVAPYEVSTKPEDKNLKLTNLTDRVFADLRDLNVTQVGTQLHQKSLSVKSAYDKRRDVQQLKEIKDFMRALPQVQETHRLLTVHTAVCSNINRRVQAPSFRKSIQIEQSMLMHVDEQDSFLFIEDMIHRGEPLSNVLRLVCLLSLTNNGLKAKYYDSLRESLMLSYGIPQIVSAFYSLERVGMLSKQAGLLTAAGLGPLAQLTGDRPSFATVRKACSLWCDHLNEKNPDSIAYAYSGYAPLLLRTVEVMSALPNWSAPHPALDCLPGDREGMIADDIDVSGSTRIVLLVVVGGMTHAEISAVRTILNQGGGADGGADGGVSGRRKQFVILTTCVTSGRKILSSLLPFDPD